MKATHISREVTEYLSAIGRRGAEVHSIGPDERRLSAMVRRSKAQFMRQGMPAETALERARRKVLKGGA